MAGVEGDVFGVLQRFFEALSHRFGVGVGEVDPADGAFEQKVAAKPDVAYFDGTASGRVARKVPKDERNPFDLDPLVGANRRVGFDGRRALAEWVVFEHEDIPFGAVDGYAQPLFELCVAPNMVEVAVGIEDGDGVFSVALDPLRRADAGIDNEIFSIHCEDVAVGLVRAHRLHL